jgi:hypothetical protein
MVLNLIQISTNEWPKILVNKSTHQDTFGELLILLNFGNGFFKPAAPNQGDDIDC